MPRLHRYNVYDKQNGNVVLENATRDDICVEFSIPKPSFQNYIKNNRCLFARRYLVSRIDEEPLYKVYILKDELLTLKEVVDKYYISKQTVESNADKKPIQGAGIYIERVK